MLYRFAIELSDIDRGIYETLEFRIAQHPSETTTYLITRVLAYALSYKEGLMFSPEGLNDPDAPALKAAGLHGAIDMWIEIGNPSARKLHKASKLSSQVIIYTYKSALLLRKEIQAGNVHRGNEIQIYAIDPIFLDSLEKDLKKSNDWSFLIQEGRLDVDTRAGSYAYEIQVVPKN